MIDDTTVSVLVAALVVVVPLYLLLAFYPAETGRWLAGHLRGAQQAASLWDLTAVVQRRRAAVRWLLGVLILAVSGVALAALPAARQRFSPRLPDADTILWVLAFVAGIAVAARLRAAGLWRPALPEITDAAFTDRVRQSMEGVSIAANVSIWECGLCKGAWVRAGDLARFGAHREARRHRQSPIAGRAD